MEEVESGGHSLGSSTPTNEPVEDTFISDPPEEEATRDYDEEPAEDREETQAASEPEEQPRKSREEEAPPGPPPPSSSDNKRRRIAVSVKQGEPSGSRAISGKRHSPSSEHDDREMRHRKDRGDDRRGEDRRGHEERRPRYDDRIDRMGPSSSQRGFFGFVFGCTAQTFDECMDLSILAGPRQMMREVLQISAFDTPMFLFHITHRTLYGVLEATCQGSENLIPNAFQTVARSPNPFPAQVAFRFKYQFLPLPEAKFAHLIPYHHNKPAPSLSREHVRSLIQAFAENDATTAARAREQLWQFYKI